MQTTRLKIEDRGHLMHMAYSGGIMAAKEALEEIPESLQRTPGFALALATITAKAETLRSEVVADNLKMIAKAGHDISQIKSVFFDTRAGELVCEPHEVSETHDECGS